MYGAIELETSYGTIGVHLLPAEGREPLRAIWFGAGAVPLATTIDGVEYKVVGVAAWENGSWVHGEAKPRIFARPEMPLAAKAAMAFQVSQALTGDPELRGAEDAMRKIDEIKTRIGRFLRRDEFAAKVAELDDAIEAKS